MSRIHTWYLIVLIGSAIIFALYFKGAQLGILTMAIGDDVISDDSYYQVIKDPSSGDAYSAYYILTKRKSNIAVDLAAGHLSSRDPYLWFNAAIYLGEFGDTRAVPYLIKGLRHKAWRNHGKLSQILSKITGMNYGIDYTQWKNWFLASNPSFVLDWDSLLGN